MTTINYSQIPDEDRPVVSISKIGNKPLDVFMCSADAEIIAEDLPAERIIDVCNGTHHNSMYKWAWYNEAEHGSYKEVAKNLYVDLDDAARDYFDEAETF